MSELKACPFCGGEAIKFSNGCRVWITCTSCGGSTKGFQDLNKHIDTSKDAAIAAWNRRVKALEGGDKS